MEGLAIGGIVLFVMSGLFFWIYQKEKKQIDQLQQDLNFFKKEKEYYDEAMFVLDNQGQIVFANGSARKLFWLDEKYRLLPDAKKVELKIDSHQPRDFFIVLSEQVASHKESFHLRNALLIVMNKTQQTNIYVDKTQPNGTITCVVDMKRTANTTEVKVPTKEGGADFLTGLPSQFIALNSINTQVMNSQKNSEPFALLLLGIDHFAELQSTMGLDFTNQLLKKIANYFIENQEENTKVYRMDCDKFLIATKHLKEGEVAKKIARKIVADIADFYKIDSGVRITTSVGIAMYPEHGGNAIKLINHAYQALAYAKEVSESSIEIFNLAHQGIRKDEKRINEEIQKGLKRHEFLLYYQPIFSLKNEEMIGAEALLRWKHPELGIVSAEKFLGVAEKTGLIVDIGEYAFREAIKQRKFWDDEGLKKFKITLNISLKEMQTERLVQKLSMLFEGSGVDPLEFNLDVKEAAAMANIEQTMIDFKLFRELGLSISLDNFGAGNSSIKHLQMLPLSMIKIDRSLIFDLYTNLDHQITVKAMINMIHALGFKAVAEGVETTKESTLLYELGCDYAQGYLYSKPLPATEFRDLVR